MVSEKESILEKCRVRRESRTTSECPQVNWWDWVTLSTPDIVKLGVPKEQVSSLRFQRVGLHKPLTRQWARAVGLWGGQKTAKEIGQLLGISKAAVFSYANYWGAKVLTRGCRRTYQVEVAINACATLQAEPRMPIPTLAREACILPPELVYYEKALVRFEDIVQESEGVTLDELVEEHTLEGLQGCWEDCKCVLKAPWGNDDEEDNRKSIIAKLRGRKSTAS
jgi:hypothetical protein